MREGKGAGDACCFILVLECSPVYTEVKGGNEIVVNKENKENKQNKQNSDRGA